MLKRGLIFALILMLTSCFGEDNQMVETGGFKLVKTDYNSLDGWENDDFNGVAQALNGVCRQLAKTPKKQAVSEVMRYSLDAYKKHCAKMLSLTDEAELKSYIRKHFEPYAVVMNDNDEGKFTSYYEASLRASFDKGGKYQYPVYGKPNDLVEVNLRDFDDTLPNQRLVGRVKNGKLIKYYTRAEIDGGELDAPVILWGDDPVDIYIMQIQGAAVATLPNGKEIRVGYADNNGYKFRGIGSILLEKKLIKPNEASMPKIREWLKENGDTAKKNMLLNNRFIFHKIVEASGPVGAMGLPLTAGRSLAVDKAYIPLGSLLWLDTTSPTGDKIQKVVMAQDVGGAIKGAIRGDYFWGHGEEALEYAGRMNAKGRYFMLLPKGTEVSTNGR